MIKFINVKKEYDKSPYHFTALKDINLTINDNEFIAITGRSGSGKSTMLNLIATIDSPTTGEIWVNNKQISEFKMKEREIYRNKEIGFVFQFFYLEPTYTVYENVEIPLLIAKVDKKTRNKKILLCLEKVNMLEKIHSLSKNLSGGEKQRVSIARALINDSPIILADEPCGNLDYENGQNIMRILRNLTNEGKTIILVTHNLEDSKLTDRCIILKDGMIISDAYN